jgi:hypothetical protein
MSDIEVRRAARGFSSWGGAKLLDVEIEELSIDLDGKMNIDWGRDREDAGDLVLLTVGCNFSSRAMLC